LYTNLGVWWLVGNAEAMHIRGLHCRGDVSFAKPGLKARFGVISRATDVILKLEGTVDRGQLLGRLDKAWRDFQEAYAGLTETQLVEPGVSGDWSVRDILAHVTSWEQEALKHLPTLLEGGKPPRYSVTHGGIHAFNRTMTEQKSRLTLAEVRKELGETHQRLITLIESVPQERFRTETPFRHRLRLDSYSHYPKHADAIRRWRRRVKPA